MNGAFGKRAGKKTAPTADPIPRTVQHGFEDQLARMLDPEYEHLQYRFCTVRPREGCYQLTFRPKNARPWLFSTVYKGTLRLENAGNDIVVSGDLYKFGVYFPIEKYGIPRKYERRWSTLRVDEELRAIEVDLREDLVLDRFKLPVRKSIPIYARDKYYSYLEGVSALLTSLTRPGQPCRFSLTFDEFVYQHPASGFDGDFPAAADRRVRMELSETATADYYTGRLYEGDTELGSLTLCWVSSFFRRAELHVHELEGAVMPQPVPNAAGTGNEDFDTVFETAGWHLSVTRHDDAVALPDSLNGVQDPDDCWNPDFDNMHDLMDSLPGYDSSVLDRRWKAYLVAIPADLGCSRGWMFDTGGGDVNEIAREGAVTHSDDGYPSTDNASYGTAEDELQRDHPRAFLRSAAHEVGHTFNQIHQNFEGGNDNSIMTVTPSVSNVLDAAGEDFPDDIDLTFNATVRRHLIHLPDPAVRPGAMDFFGTAVTAPEADTNFFDEEDLELEIDLPRRASLGEPLRLRWRVTNRMEDALPVPEQVDAEHHVARVSVTGPTGEIRFMKPTRGRACSAGRVSALDPTESRQAQTLLFWSRNGFAFESPGRHRVDLMLLWEIDGLPVGVRASRWVWVDYPVDEDANRVAELMLDDDVGRFIANGGNARYEEGLARVRSVIESHGKHSAVEVLRDLVDRSEKRAGSKRQSAAE